MLYYFVERLKKTFPDLGIVPTFVRDIINVCVMADFSRDNLALKSAASALKRVVKQAKIVRTEKDPKFYHFTTEFLFMKGKLSEEEYYFKTLHWGWKLLDKK